MRLAVDHVEVSLRINFLKSSDSGPPNILWTKCELIPIRVWHCSAKAPSFVARTIPAQVGQLMAARGSPPIDSGASS